MFNIDSISAEPGFNSYSMDHSAAAYTQGCKDVRHNGMNIAPRRIAIKCLIIIALLWRIIPAGAQQWPRGSGLKKVYPLSAIGVSGTPSRLFFDKKGLLWIGSTAGLASFDGRAFKTYTAEDGLAGNFITDIETDPGGVLYIASQQGVSRYTGHAGKPFERLQGLDSLFFITCIIPLSHDTLLLGDLAHFGLHKWTNNRIDEPYPNIATESVINDMYRDGRGTIYLTQKSNLFVLRGSRDDSASIAVSGKRWATVVPGATGTVWCAAGKLYHARAEGITDSLEMPPSDATLLNRVVAAPGGHLIISNNGLWQYNPASRQWDTMVAPGSLGGPVAFALSADSQMVWACGRFGLARIYAPPAMTRVSPTAGPFITDKGELLTATTGAVRITDNEAIARQAPGAVIRQTYRDRSGRMWYLTSAGVYWREVGALKHYSPPYKVAEQGIVFNTALEDSAGALWFGTERGMLRYNGRQFFTPLMINAVYNDEKYSYHPEGNTFALVRGKGGKMLGGCREFLYIASPDMHVRENNNSHNSTSINCSGFVRNSEGDIWAILDDHLRGVADHTDVGGNLEVSDSLPMVSIPNMTVAPQGLDFDGNNNLWVLGQRALYVYLRQPGARHYNAARMYLFTANDLPGLLTGDVAETIMRDTAGNILIGHDGQAYRLNAMALIASAAHAQPPTLSFSALLLNGRPADWPMDPAGGQPAAPRFSDSVRSLAFYFTATAPLNAEYISYAYRLAGYNNEWSSNGTSGEFSFTGLPAGTYNLEVRATDINGRQSNIVALPFTILPPWYRSAWAWAIWIALGAAAIWGLFRLRLRAVRRKAAVDRLIAEQQLKALRAQINPHFLQNTFSFLSQTLDEQPKPYTRKVISQLGAYLRAVLDRSDESVTRLEDEIEFAGEYLAINRLLFRDSFSYDISVADDVDTVGVKVPSMLLQPVLENAVKHGVRYEAGGSITLKIYREGPATYCAICNTTAPLPVPLSLVPTGLVPGSPVPPSFGGGRGEAMTASEEAATTQATPSKAPPHLPKGLTLTEDRLSLLYGKSQPFISHSSIDGQYCVMICIPQT